MDQQWTYRGRNQCASPEEQEVLYNPEKAREVAQDTFQGEDTPDEQLRKITKLPNSDFRQVVLGIFMGDI